MRASLLGLIALAGLGMATPANASETAQKNKAAATEAKQVTGRMVRSQQAYYLEESTFAKTLKELSIKEETSSYRYRIFPASQADQYVMMASIPKRQGLPTYIGLVNITAAESGEATSFGIVCGSTQAKAITPSWNMIAQPKPQQSFVCPKGFKAIN